MFPSIPTDVAEGNSPLRFSDALHYNSVISAISILG